MTEARGGAAVHLSADEPLPLEVPAGNSVALTLRVSCADQHDRAGLAITVAGPDGQSASHVLVADPNGGDAMAVLALTSPRELGQYVYRVTTPAHEIAGTPYAEAALDVPMRVVPQATSLAVWDVPLSVVQDSALSVKAGAKSAANASLAGCPIEVVDETGAIAGRGRLGDAPLAGTVALYWTEIAFTAPRREGLATFAARFAAAGLDLPHNASGTSFSVAIVASPEHLLHVKVIEQASCAPIPDVELRLGAYRGTTGEAGLAQIALPKGRYELHVWKVGFEAPARTIEIDGDALVQIEATVVPEEDPDARWRM